MEQCDIRRPKQWIVTMQITCGAGEPLESACWLWRPIMGDRLGDPGIRRRESRASVACRRVANGR